MPDAVAGSARIVIKLDSTQLEQGLNSVKNSLRQFQSQTAAVANAFAVPMKAGVESFAEFDDAIRNVGAKARQGSTSLEELADLAQKYGRESSFTALEIAQTMVKLGEALGNRDDVAKSIGPVKDLARATGTDLASAAEIALTAMHSFGMQSSDLAHIADVLTATTNNSAQNLYNFGEAIKQAGSAGDLTGHSLEEFSVGLALIANYGLKGSQAGTALKNVFTRLSDGKVQNALREIGVEVKNNEGGMRSFLEILPEMGDAISKLDKDKQLSLWQNAFSMRGMNAAARLGNGRDSMSSLTDIIQNAGGVAAQTAAEMDAGMGGSIRLLKSAVDGLVISFGEGLVPVIKEFVDAMTPAATKVAEFIKANPELVSAIAKIGTAFIGVNLGAKVFANAFNAIAAAVHAMSAGVNAVPTVVAFIAKLASNPVTAGIAALAVALGTVFIALRRSANSASELNKELAEMVEKNAEMRRGDIERLHSLGGYTGRKLSDQEQEQVNLILEPLKARYQNLGVTIKDGILTGLEGAEKAMTSDFQRNAVSDWQKQIEGLQANIEKINSEALSRTRRQAMSAGTKFDNAANRTALPDKPVFTVKETEQLRELTAKIQDLTESIKFVEAGAIELATGMSKQDWLSSKAMNAEVAGQLQLPDVKVNGSDADERTAAANEKNNKELEKLNQKADKMIEGLFDVNLLPALQ